MVVFNNYSTRAWFWRSTMSYPTGVRWYKYVGYFWRIKEPILVKESLGTKVLQYADYKIDRKTSEKTSWHFTFEQFQDMSLAVTDFSRFNQSKQTRTPSRSSPRIALMNIAEFMGKSIKCYSSPRRLLENIQFSPKSCTNSIILGWSFVNCSFNFHFKLKWKKTLIKRWICFVLIFPPFEDIFYIAKSLLYYKISFFKDI